MLQKKIWIRFGLAAIAGAAMVLSGCGSVIGDACTTQSDCGSSGYCLNSTAVPGGYCTKQCTSTDANPNCPGGSTCVPQAISTTSDGCMRSCTVDGDCRKGYTCNVPVGGTKKVCLSGGI